MSRQPPWLPPSNSWVLTPPPLPGTSCPSPHFSKLYRNDQERTLFWSPPQRYSGVATPPPIHINTPCPLTPRSFPHCSSNLYRNDPKIPKIEKNNKLVRMNLNDTQPTFKLNKSIHSFLNHDPTLSKKFMMGLCCEGMIKQLLNRGLYHPIKKQIQMH